MNRYHRLFLLPLTLLVLALPTRAQDLGDETVILAVSSHECAWTSLEEVVERMDEGFYPLAQEAVDADEIRSAGMAVHHYGDASNLVTWTTGNGLESTLRGSWTLNGRYAEADAEASSSFLEACPSHTDRIYALAAATEGGDEALESAETYTLAVSNYACPFGIMEELQSEYERVQLPFAQELVGEGELIGEQLWFHAYGDEWTVLVATAAADLPTLLAAREDMNERVAGFVTEEDRNFFEMGCTGHMDNIYTVVARTE